MNITKRDLGQYEKIDSIDEAAEVYDQSIYKHEIFKEDGVPDIDNAENFSLIRPEEEFWGHCSNLQVWAEHDYDTRLLKTNLAFPLLERLSKVGDKRAKIKFKEEIINRLLSGNEKVIEYLFVENYQEHLSNEELVFGLLEPMGAEILMKIQQKLNIVFKYVPTIDRDIEFPHYTNLEEIKKIRKFSTESKYVNSLELTFKELVSVTNEITKLKELKQIRLFGNFLELNPEEIIKSVRKLKSIEEIFLNSRLVKDLDNTKLKKIKEMDIKISPLLSIMDLRTL